MLLTKNLRITYDLPILSNNCMSQMKYIYYVCIKHCSFILAPTVAAQKRNLSSCKEVGCYESNGTYEID